MSTFCKYNAPDCYGARELEVLLELSNLLSNKEINLDKVLEILAQHLAAERILVTIVNRESSEIVIEGSYGVLISDKKDIVYHTG